MKRIELPEQIKYYVKLIENKTTPVHLKKEYLRTLSEYYYEIERTLDRHQLELFDYKNKVENK